jgi:hypothetical protein
MIEIVNIAKPEQTTFKFEPRFICFNCAKVITKALEASSYYLTDLQGFPLGYKDKSSTSHFNRELMYAHNQCKGELSKAYDSTLVLCKFEPLLETFITLMISLNVLPSKIRQQEKKEDEDK